MTVVQSRRLDRNRRLLKSADFSAVFKHTARRVAVRHLLILVCQSKQTVPRLGMIVAKRHIKSAVRRNFLKRQIREWFRHNQQHIRHCDIVVILRGAPRHQDSRAAFARYHRQALEEAGSKLMQNLGSG